MAGAHGTGQRPATLAEIREMIGDLEAAKLEAILATGATPGQIEEAMAWAAGESDVIGGDLPRPRPTSGSASRRERSVSSGPKAGDRAETIARDDRRRSSGARSVAIFERRQLAREDLVRGGEQGRSSVDGVASAPGAAP